MEQKTEIELQDVKDVKDVAKYLIEMQEKNLDIYSFVIARCKTKTDLWEIIKLIHGGDVNWCVGCTGKIYSDNFGQPRLALCELTDWVEELLMKLYCDQIDLTKQGVPTGVLGDVVENSKVAWKC